MKHKEPNVNRRPAAKKAKGRKRRSAHNTYDIIGKLKDILEDPATCLGLGMMIGTIGAKLGLSDPKCTHAEPIPCPTDASGAFTDPKCRHYGHVPGMCHTCYCLRCTCFSPMMGVPCPPDCKTSGFDTCHRRDCLKDCTAAQKPTEIVQ